MPQAPDRTPRPAPAPARVRRMRPALGTFVVIEAGGPSPDQALVALEAAFAAVQGLARSLHPSAAGSELARLNAAAPGEPVRLAIETAAVLRFALALNHASGGVFDPCLPTRPGRLSDLKLGGGEAPEAVCRLPLALDLGGLAKGYAVDVAIETLRRGGCDAGLVNAGGDLRCFGGYRERLFLRHAGGELAPLELADSAVAVSDRDALSRPAEHRGYYCRVAAASGEVRYAAVRAPTAMCADALTKCVLLCPPRRAGALLERFGAERLA